MLAKCSCLPMVWCSQTGNIPEKILQILAIYHALGYLCQIWQICWVILWWASQGFHPLTVWFWARGGAPKLPILWGFAVLCLSLQRILFICVEQSKMDWCDNFFIYVGYLLKTGRFLYEFYSWYWYDLVLPWHVLLTIVYMFRFTYQFFELLMIPNTIHVFWSYWFRSAW
jgi:hypothetical protein